MTRLPPFLPDWTTVLRRFAPAARCLSCLILGCLIALPGHAVSAPTTPPATKEEPPLLDVAQQQASEAVIDAAQWLDQFFYDDTIRYEENRTRIRFELSSGYTRFEEIEFKPRLSGRIHLPNLNRKINILIAASDDDEFLAEQNPISAIPRHRGAREREVSTALQYFIREGKSDNLSATLGASFDYLFAGVRYRRSHDLGAWHGRFVNRLNYYTDDEWEDTISYEIGHLLGDRWLFRTKASVDWHVEEDGFPHSLVFRLFQKLNDRKAMLYEFGNYFDTEDSYEMTDLQLKVHYRQRFLRDWLVLEIAPQIGFPEDHDREANPGIIVKFEADTGYLAGTDVFPRIFNF